MELGSILLGAAVGLGLGAFVIDPLLRDSDQEYRPVHQTETNHDVLVAMRDLEFDFETGKINSEDYAVLHHTLLLQASEQLQTQRGDSHVCPECQQSYTAGDRYCIHCGQDLATETLTSEQGT